MCCRSQWLIFGNHPRYRALSQLRKNLYEPRKPNFAAPETCAAAPPRPHHEPAKHRDHRARRPWENHARRPTPPPGRLLPREPARRRTRHGFQRPRKGARHHHPRQGDFGRLEGLSHQHRRHPRPRRFRRRGRAHPFDGGFGHRAGRRRRRPDAADQVRRRQGAEGRPEADRRDQQDRPSGCPPRRGRQRGVRPLRRARRHRRAARLPDPLRFGPRRLGLGKSGRPEGPGPGAACSTSIIKHVPAPARPSRPVPHDRHAARSQSVPRPHHHRPHRIRLAEVEPGGQGAGQ